MSSHDVGRGRFSLSARIKTPVAELIHAKKSVKDGNKATDLRRTHEEVALRMERSAVDYIMRSRNPCRSRAYPQSLPGNRSTMLDERGDITTYHHPRHRNIRKVMELVSTSDLYRFRSVRASFMSRKTSRLSVNLEVETSSALATIPL